MPMPSLVRGVLSRAADAAASGCRLLRTRGLAVACAVALASAAVATPFTDSLTALDAAVDARIAALPVKGGTRAEKTERTQLGRASTALGRVTGSDIAADAAAVAAAAKALRASRSTDAGVVAAAEAALAALLDELNTRQAEAADAVFRVQDPVARAKAAKLLDAAAKLAGRAAEAAEGDPSAAMKLLAGAITRVATAFANVESLPGFLDAPEGIHPYRPGGRGDFYLINQSGSTVTVEEVVYEVAGTFYDGSVVPLRITQQQLLAKFFVSPPSSTLPTDDSYDCGGPYLVSLFTKMEKQRRSDFAGFSGRAIVRLTGYAPFVVSVSGR